MAGLEEARVTQASNFFDRLRTIEDSIATINSTVDNILTKMANSVLALLTAPGGALTLQTAKLATQNLAIDRLLTAVTSLTEDAKRLGSATETLTLSRSPPDSPLQGSPAKKHCTEGAPASAKETDDANAMRLE
jgi:hypothetical protein